MELNPLTAIGPVDGRYHNATKDLSVYFSESGLIQYRIRVEVYYLLALAELPIPNIDFAALLNHAQQLKDWASNPLTADILRVKEIEKTTNHDVKAVEYVVKEKLDEMGLSAYREWVHFGLTSQDINNTSIPLSLKEALHNHILPQLDGICQKLIKMAEDWKDIPMLAKTHGQPASPTRLGKIGRAHV